MPKRPKPKSQKLDALDMPVEQFLTYRLLTLTNRLNRQAMHILEETAGLRLPEWRCLAFIHQSNSKQGKTGLHDLADKTGMDRALISRSVQGLVQKGYVLTERDGEDRRIVNARLTPPGEKLYDRILPLMQRRQMYLLDALSPAETRGNLWDHRPAQRSNREVGRGLENR